MKLSICIPTYNRAKHLANCLHSVAVNGQSADADFEVCVSDNHSADGTEDVVRDAQKRIKLKYRRNSANLGVARNFLNAVDMAEGDFIWLIGDDDLLLPGAIETALQLIQAHPVVDFFYVNSCHLSTEYVFSFAQPFDPANLPAKMARFSSWQASGRLRFLELVDPRISFDFLMGMYLAVFRRSNWLAHVGALDAAALADPRMFSHFDNTCPHLKIFSRAFANSEAYLHVEPLTAALSGAREWAPMYPLVRSVRMPEALAEFRKNGLPLGQYLKCRNNALAYFLPDLVYMFLHRARSGYDYINPVLLLLRNLPFPNVYLSPLYYFLRKLGAT